GLYWGGSTAKPVSGRNKVKLKLPNETGYMDIVADEDFGAFGNEHYQCFTDITTLVNNNSQTDGTYWVANVDAQEGKSGVEAGWTIVIVYQNDLAPSYRNLTVFDGLAGIQSNGAAYDIPVSGFLTPPVGPVSFELGFVAYEGDRGLTGDYMSFNGNIIADAAHNTNNTFNASITYNGSIVTTRNPVHANTLGYDASILMFPNKSSTVKLGNNVSTAKVTLATSQDRYAIGVVTTAIDVLNPYYTFYQSFSNITSPGQPIKVGETVEFTYTLKNIGNDISKNTVFTNTISPLLTNITQLQTKTDNGAWVNYTTNKDGDAAEFINNQITFRVGSGANSTKGGDVSANSTVTIKFRATLTGNCDLLRCSGGSFSNSGTIDFDGKVNAANHWTISSSPQPITGQCDFPSAPVAIPIVVPATCTTSLPDKNFDIACETNVSTFNLPANYLLYAASDIAYTTPLSKVSTAGDYVA
ncbi:MAG TPA: hypothetical protein VEV15_01740, partial [Flavisolibacter sp.]|nr:hypothetical protein [Flavisolibacter sp.]